MDAEEPADIELDPEDLVFETRSHYPRGAQYTYPGNRVVRVTHKPTGLVAESWHEVSEMGNRREALRKLRKNVRWLLGGEVSDES
jgi:protein subunit release factor A